MEHTLQSIDMIVHHQDGLHARPAALFVQTVKLFKSDIQVSHRERTVDGKSILSILTLIVHQGDEIRISANGPDEEEAIRKLKTLIKSNFEM